MAELLTTFSMSHSRDETKSSLVAAFRARFMDHFEREKGKMLQTSIWKATRKRWLFTQLVNFDVLQDYSYFVELYVLIYGEQTTDISSLFEEQHKTTSVLNMANILAVDDQLLGDIKQDENAYFCNVEPERHALTRKLTLASVLSRGLVADRKLWH